MSIHPAKRLRLGESDPSIEQRAVKAEPSSRLVFRNPNISVLPTKFQRSSFVAPQIRTSSVEREVSRVNSTFTVLWRKCSAKKNKTWDGDGTVKVCAGVAMLQNEEGQEIGRTTCENTPKAGMLLQFGGKEAEVQDVLESCHIKADSSQIDVANKHNNKVHLLCNSRPIFKRLSQVIDSKPISRQEPRKNPPADIEQEREAPQPRVENCAFKSPLLEQHVQVKTQRKVPTPRHDPLAQYALVMKRPEEVPEGKQIVDVVVDPILAKNLRPHQQEGVKFLYECVMGLRGFPGNGAILADEMGLGKTLQTIALIWTLLKQNPIDGEPPVARKALVVCPVTLINNWRKEFRKWLGVDRIGVFVYDDNSKRVSDFTKGRAYNVMIVGYEKLRTISEELKQGRGIDVIICDEGHRLKTATNKSTIAIKSIDACRRIVLSGTPIQNDLSEFFMMVDLVNPGILGSLKSFAKEFEGPIVRSRQPHAHSKDREAGQERSEELAELTNPFILRRTAEILAKFLPPKTEYVLFCQPTRAQATVYRDVLACPVFASMIGNSEGSLQLITLLKKVCNSPALLRPSDQEVESKSGSNQSLAAAVANSIPSRSSLTNQASAKLRTLDQLLHTIRTTTSEKVVLVSNYTSTLNLFEILLSSLSHPYLRLDGTTPSAKRQELVDSFNRSSQSQCFAFLLSAKSGGVGLNLIGASRLILFDVDWNPATDLQAMARIHRDGQKLPCVIYRLLMAGGIDEKIWQRQVTKLGLASNIMDQDTNNASFSREDLRDLFRLDDGSSCQTHDLLRCPCEGQGLLPVLGAEADTQLEGEDATQEASHAGPPKSPFQPANTINIQQQEEQIKFGDRSLASKISKSAYLMLYKHIKVVGPTQDNADSPTDLHLSDDVLRRSTKDEGNKISFIFAKTAS